MSVPRGIRNKNPGNIRWGDPWEGLVPEAQRTDTSFCQFTDTVYGIRALAKILLTYQAKYKLDSVEAIIRRWAPPVENDTGAYVNAVAAHMRVPASQPLDLTDASTLRPLVEGIILHENGTQPYTQTLIDDALARAGVAA